MSSFETPDSHLSPAEQLAAAREDALARLREAVEQARLAQELVESLALEAREYGASWRAVGEATGMTPQGAHQHWAEAELERKVRRMTSQRAAGSVAIEGTEPA